ncbi:MAG: hypothetical protein M3Y48_09585 [Actinomycetota bacterium]|nr:hypothetical protein [Actinomycetota bacterium]
MITAPVRPGLAPSGHLAVRTVPGIDEAGYHLTRPRSGDRWVIRNSNEHSCCI